MPSYIVRKNEISSLSDVLASTNRVCFNQVLGNDNPSPLPGTTIYLDDTAKLHVLALDPKIAENRDIPAGPGGIDDVKLSDALDIATRKFRVEIANGLLPNTGSQPTVRVKLGVSKTEKVFGRKFEGLDTQIEEIGRYYLELLKESKGEPTEGLAN